LIVVIFTVLILDDNDSLAVVDRKSTRRDGEDLTRSSSAKNFGDFDPHF